MLVWSALDVNCSLSRGVDDLREVEMRRWVGLTSPYKTLFYVLLGLTSTTWGLLMAHLHMVFTLLNAFPAYPSVRIIFPPLWG